MLAYSVATKSFLQRNARAIVCSNKDKTRKSNSRYRIRKAARTYIASVGFGTIILLFGFKLFCEQIWGSSSDQLAWNKNSHIVTSRSILWQAGENETKCSPPSIQEFPTELFSIRQLKHGGVLLHIAVSVYMFIALAFVCDDYFVASLDKICEHLKLSEDIAGATFMAAGSSAPELFTSLIGLFIVHGDVGTGTIVGSAVFNVLIILALVSLWAGQVTSLTRWPLCRDSISYCIAVISLIVVMNNGQITWYESLIMLLLYAGYLAVMKFNKKLMKLFKVRSPEEEIEEGNQALDQQREGTPGEDEAAIYRCGSPESYELVAKRLRRLTWREVGMMIMLSSQFPPATRFRAACYMITLRQENEHKGLLDSGGESETENNSKKTAKEHEMGSIDVQIEGGPFMDQDRSVFGLAFWLFSRPIIILLYYTIPDCKKEKWERFYLATFFMSIVWIAVFSYIMVWMVTVVGFVLGIPDVIMGITFLAAGTSIPDAIASLIVSRQGLGDMAVSNSIGSNVFDILIGLAFPWFIHTAIISPGSEVSVNSRGLKYSVILLLGSVLLTVLTIHVNKWRLDRKTGVIFTLLYLIFVTISCLIEFNIFGFVNLPVCSLVY
ncbi:sodium/potassium/calcium exchanger 4-like [Rhopilema esculentum]|uniref:sodium/potassium/calcium exchanger 4-like n=1 Tax=Rhopilema esculentum TaxID=499914 RepID=UPI0031D03856